MNKCPSCGGDLVAGGKFCPKCGAEVRADETARLSDWDEKFGDSVARKTADIVYERIKRDREQEKQTEPGPTEKRKSGILD